LVHSFVWGIPSGRTNNSPESGRGRGHATPTIWQYGRLSQRQLGFLLLHDATQSTLLLRQVVHFVCGAEISWSHRLGWNS